VVGDVRDLIPKSKVDLATAEAAVTAGFPAVLPILPDLFVWLQDANWPVAKILAPFLAGIGAPALPAIRYVLASSDIMWKYWVLTMVVENLPLHALEGLRLDLVRLAAEPSEEAVEVEARRILSLIPPP